MIHSDILIGALAPESAHDRPSAKAPLYRNSTLFVNLLMLYTELIKRMSHQVLTLDRNQDVHSLSWLLDYSQVFISTTGLEKEREGMNVPFL